MQDITIRDVAKSWAKRLPYPAIHAGFQGYHQLFWVRRFRDTASREGIPPISDHTLRQLKRSTTVFILGSGASINEISASRWRGIRAADSFAFNFFLRHAHVPTLYMYESMERSVNPAIFERFAALARERAAAYAGVPKLVTAFGPHISAEQRSLPLAWRRDVFASPVVSSYARSESEFAHSIAALRSLGKFSQRRAISDCFKYRGSVTALITLAHRLGYANIVLCGIDLSDPRYFYQNSDMYPDMADFFSSRPGTTHATLVSHANWIAIDSVIRILHEKVLQPAGTNLFVENRSSALHEFLPVAPESLYS